MGTPGSQHGALVGIKDNKSGESFSILFVCSANMCRSPMAEVLFKEFLRIKGQPSGRWKVESAGIYANQNNSSTTFAQEVIAELGLDLSQHRSQPVTFDLVESFQLIVTMEKWQRQFIQQLCPNISDRVYLLSQISGVEKDIIDSVGMSKNDYRIILKEIQSYFLDGWNNIIRLAK